MELFDPEDHKEIEFEIGEWIVTVNITKVDDGVDGNDINYEVVRAECHSCINPADNDINMLNEAVRDYCIDEDLIEET